MRQTNGHALSFPHILIQEDYENGVHGLTRELFQRDRG